jgi:hypothetical protein
MNEETLNLTIRRFLKQFGVTAQREVERAVREAAARGRLGAGPLKAQALLEIDGLGRVTAVEGEIAFD